MASPLVIPKARFFDDNGLPLVGGKLYSYAAGTTTPKATYTDATGTVPNANPVILDAAGEAAIWLGGAYKLKLTDDNDVEQWTIDNVKEFLVAPAGSFTLVSSAPTVIDATTFSIPGDQTPFFFAGQRVKFTTSGSTIYATVVSAIFGAGITTVVLSNGPINVGAPTGAYAGLGHPGVPLDSSQVSYTPTKTVKQRLDEMFDPDAGGSVGGPTVFEDVVAFEEDVTFEQDVNILGNLQVDGNLTVDGVLKANVIAEGAINTAGDTTTINIPAAALARIADGTIKRLRLRVLDLTIDADIDNFSIEPKITFNGDVGANYTMLYTIAKNTFGGGDDLSSAWSPGNTEVRPNPGGQAKWDTVWGAFATIAKMALSFEMEITGLLLEDRIEFHVETKSLAPMIQGLSEGRQRVTIVGEWFTLAPLTSITILLDDNTNPKAHSGTYQLLGEP